MKKCKHCKKPYLPKNSLQMVCSLQCAVARTNTKDAKIVMKRADAEQKKEMQLKLKTLGDYKKDLQVEVNKIVRLIDQGASCISCGSLNGKENAGHYYSVGARPNLRYHLMNIWKQCEQCNTHLSGNLIEYRAELVSRYSNNFMEFLSDLNIEHKDLKLMQFEVTEATKIAKQIVKELTTLNKSDKLPRTISERREMRVKYNLELGIY